MFLSLGGRGDRSAHLGIRAAGVRLGAGSHILYDPAASDSLAGHRGDSPGRPAGYGGRHEFLAGAGAAAGNPEGFPYGRVCRDHLCGVLSVLLWRVQPDAPVGAAGGGGKGIRRVNDEDELTTAFEEARREAQNGFGDNRMYLEKIMENVKHIEVQIFRDQAGHTVYFPERDCSVQRSKQKMIEESPCSVITPAQRKELGQIAVRAANAIDYLNTGTIEFLMDSEHHFYFMEMNTRIQVEHTVTEMVTGIDLVKAQVKVASGEDLPFKQADIKANGYAIECRINAEDPAKNFMPSVGKVKYLYFPVGNLGMRIDSDLYSGLVIPPYYDSMIAKVIALGHDRHEAIEKVKRLLNEMVILGITTNQAIHLDILQAPTFLKDQVTTDYLEREFLPKWKEGLDSATV